MRKWKGWDVLEGKFNKESGKVGICLNESSMNKWKGWDVLGGKFDEKMERLGCT